MPTSKKEHPFPEPPAHIEWYRDMGNPNRWVIKGGGYTVRVDVTLLDTILRDTGRRGLPTILESYDRIPFRDLFMAALDPSFRASWATVIERPTSKRRARYLRHWRVTIATNRRRLKRLRSQ